MQTKTEWKNQPTSSHWNLSPARAPMPNTNHTAGVMYRVDQNTVESNWLIFRFSYKDERIRTLTQRSKNSAQIAVRTGFDSKIHLLLPSSRTSFHHRRPTRMLHTSGVGQESVATHWSHRSTTHRPVTFFTVQKSQAIRITHVTNTA